ncbi:hypothetical protein VPH35_071851 [Triticum aestivum]
MVRLEQLPISYSWVRPLRWRMPCTRQAHCARSRTWGRPMEALSRDPEHVRVQLELQGRHAAAADQQGNPQRHRKRALHAMERLFGAAAASMVRIVSPTMDGIWVGRRSRREATRGVRS